MTEPADAPPEDLDALVARVDPDRWLSGRLIADRAVREEVMALYAFDHELGRAPKVASNPLLAEIRLTWWREVLDEVFEARPVRHHPTAQALARLIARHGLRRDPFERMIDGRYRELEAEPMTAEEAEAWARATAGAAAQIAATILGGAQADGARAEAAAALWALSRRPEGLAPGSQARLRREARGLSVEAFPAAAHGALARLYGRPKAPGALARRLAVTLAALTGRI